MSLGAKGLSKGALAEGIVVWESREDVDVQDVDDSESRSFIAGQWTLQCLRQPDLNVQSRRSLHLATYRPMCSVMHKRCYNRTVRTSREWHICRSMLLQIEGSFVEYISKWSRGSWNMRLKIDAGVDLLGGHMLSCDGGAQIPCALPRRLDIVRWHLTYAA